MTPAQKFRLYLPAWGAVVRIHGWRMDRATHRLVGAPREFWGGPEPTKIYRATWQHAETLARYDRCDPRAVRPDDLRHGVHMAALGRDVSSTQLGNQQLDRVLDALALLANPEELGRALDDGSYAPGLLRWLDPESAIRHRRSWWLRHACHPAYVARVALNMFGVEDWSTLSAHQIGILYGRLKHRPGAARRAHEAAAEQPQPAHPGEEEFAAAVEMLNQEVA
jgi:hypothetical protein